MTNSNAFWFQPDPPGQTPWPVGRAGDTSEGNSQTAPGLLPILPDEITAPLPGQGAPNDSQFLRELGISGYSRVRFLNAIVGFPPLSIAVGNQVLLSSFQYQDLSEYQYVPEGFKTLTIMDTQSPRTIYFKNSLPFVSGEFVTYVILNNGKRLDVVRVPDMLCLNQPRGFSCLRVANFCYNSGPLSIITRDGKTIFSNVLFKEATTFRRIRQGTYQLYASDSRLGGSGMMPDVESIDDIPMDVSNNYIPGFGEVNPLVAFELPVETMTAYTVYIMGVEGGDPGISILVTTD